MNEPEQLKAGKSFHHLIQTKWRGTFFGSAVNIEHLIAINPVYKNAQLFKKGRIDIFVEPIGDFVTIIEIKTTDWDKVKSPNSKLLSSHCRQALRYVDKYLGDSMNVCALLIYPKPPIVAFRKEYIENYINKKGISVMWHHPE